MNESENTPMVPDIELEESTMQQFKKVVEAWGPDERKQMTDYFNSLGEEDAQIKLEIMNDVLSDYASKPDGDSNQQSPSLDQGLNLNSMMGIGSQIAKSGIPERLQTAAIAGIPAAMNNVSPQQAYSSSKQMLPIAGQSIGAVLGGFPGSVGGAAIGETAKQGLDYIDGSKSVNSDNALESAKDIGITTAATVAGEGLFRIPKAMFFAKQMGGAQRIAVGKKLGQIAEAVSNSQMGQASSVSAKNIIDKIDDVISESTFERGPLKAGLTKIRNTITNLKRDLTFDEARSLEQQLGREASFAAESSQGHFVTNPKTPKLNQGTKELRKGVSDGVDDIAEHAGHPEFKKLSTEFSKLASKFPEKDLQKGMTLGSALTNFVVSGGAGTYGITQGSVPAVVASLTAMLNAVPQKARTQIFRTLIDKPVTKVIENVARTGASAGFNEVASS